MAAGAPKTALPETKAAVVAIFSPHDLTETVNNDKCNRPHERKSRIVARLRELPQFAVWEHLEKGSWELAELVHTKEYLEFLRTAWDEWVALGERRDAGFFLDQPTLYDGVPDLVPFQIATRFDGLQRPGGSIHSKVSYYASDRVTPLYPTVATAIAHDLGVIEEAVRVALPSGDRVVYALVTQPGHHAARDTYGGYCFVNSAALAARLFQRQGLARVAVLDIDYHAGNGTASIFYNDPSVLVCSIHMHPDYDYPFTVGYADQTGGPDAMGATLNIPLQPGAAWSGAYGAAVSQAIHALTTFGPAALVLSLGVDTYQSDPVAAPGAGFKIDLDDYVSIGETIGKLKVPTVVVQEGGYHMPAVAVCATNVLVGLANARST
eukprot:m.239979 g.239979  ORF g.239979 m.239979 type:complete len:379 (-) comp22959_c0_seq1:40-1176(-)